jgi:PST family polysaccharide transporter
MRERSSRIGRDWRAVARNAAALYGVRLASYTLPLLVLPYVARVLGTEAFGLVAQAQSLALWLAILVEYGFILSGTREAARLRQDHSRLEELVASVLAAKTVLAVISLAIVAVVWGSVSDLRRDPALLAWAWAVAVSQGLSPFWFFQGLEAVRLVALLEVGGRVVMAVATILLVSSPQDGWKVLAFQAAGTSVSTAAGIALMYRRVGFRRPTWLATRWGLISGFGMFFFRGAVSLYTTANVFLLGLFAAPVEVAYFAGAEKLVRGAAGLIGPLSQALYPRMTSLLQEGRGQAARLAQISLVIMLLASGAVTLVSWAGAPWIVAVFLGSGYEAAAPVLRLLAIIAPLMAIGNVLGIQWMLPLGMDRSFNTVITLAGLLNLGLSIVLAPRFGSMGMATAVVISELFVSCTLLAVLLWRRRFPFARGIES